MEIIESIRAEHVVATPSLDAASCLLVIDLLSSMALWPARLAAALAPADPLAFDPLGPIILRSAPR